METQEVKYTGQDSIHVVLKEAAEQLDEVIVRTGYQNIDKRKLTSAVQTIKMDDIKVAGDVGRTYSRYDFYAEFRTGGCGSEIKNTGNFDGSGKPGTLWVLDGVVLTDPVNVDPAQINDLDFVNCWEMLFRG